MRRPARPVVACALALLAAGPAAADPYRDPDWRFAFDVPAGWERMSADEVETRNTVVKAMTRSDGRAYEAGFRPKDTDPGDYPFVLVRKIKGDIERATYDDIRRDFARAVRMPVKSADAKSPDPTLGTAVLDKSRNRLAVLEQFHATGVGPVRSLTVGHLGEKGVVFVHCYAQEDEFAKAKPTFDRLNDSFKYDLGYEFQAAGAPPPKAEAKKEKADQPSPGEGADGPSMEVSLAIGGVVAVIVGAFMWFVFKVAGPTPARRGRRRYDDDAPVARRPRRRPRYDD